MKVVPTKKIQAFQQGGSVAPFFTVYRPSEEPSARQVQAAKAQAAKQETKKEKKDDDISLKDVLDLVKEADGLPMERMEIIRYFSDLFAMENLTGIKTSSLTTSYLNQLWKVGVTKDNKEKFKDAVKAAQENGSMEEPAIAMNGDLVVQDSETGKLQTVSLKKFRANPDAYKILTVAQLKYLREWDSRLNFDTEAFDIISNSMGYEAFEKLLKEGIEGLGKTTVSYNGYVTNEGEASKGWQALKNLPKADRERAIQSGLTAEGMFEYNIIDSNQLGQIQELVNYLAATLPQRAKTWAAIQLGSDNPQQAIRDLILQKLLSRNTSSHTFKMDYKGSMDHVMGNTSGSKGGGKEEDPKEGFWRQAQSGKGGDTATFNLLVNKGTLSVTGKYYGATPGLDKDCSLSEYLAASGIRYMIKDPKSITFGDTKISTDSFNDVMVNSSAGAFVVTLPVKEGKVWIEIVDTYQDFEDALNRAGVKPGQPGYEGKVRELLNQPEFMALAPILQANGQLKPSNAGQFLVLEGLTSSKASGISNSDRKKHSFDDINSNYILSVGDDKEMYRTLETGLSSEGRGKYSLDYNEWWDVPAYFGRYDKLYKGNIYIPLTTNPLNAANADGNEVKESTAKRMEAAQQIWEKENIKGPTNSGQLWQR